MRFKAARGIPTPYPTTEAPGPVHVPVSVGDGNANMSRLRKMKVGDLVKYKGVLGIVTAPCIKRWAKSGDVWVLWSNRRKPIVECGGFMELVNASR
jgi:hypothetical protein